MAKVTQYSAKWHVALLKCMNLFLKWNATLIRIWKWFVNPSEPVLLSIKRVPPPVCFPANLMFHFDDYGLAFWRIIENHSNEPSWTYWKWIECGLNIDVAIGKTKSPGKVWPYIRTGDRAMQLALHREEAVIDGGRHTGIRTVHIE